MAPRNFTRLSLFAGTVIVLLLGSFRPTSTVSVSGKIVWTDKSHPASFTGMTIFVGDNAHPWSHNAIDSAQHYSIGFTDDRERYRFFITDSIDTLLLDNFRPQFYDEAATADFILPKVYKKKGGKAICPVCEKTDSVLGIVYGDGVPLKLDEDGNPKIIPGGCIVSPISPHWRCKRDKVNF